MSETKQDPQNSTTQERPAPSLDPRLAPFTAPNCPINRMYDAQALVDNDPTIRLALPQISDDEIDFNGDGNLARDAQGEYHAASNREWAMALVAAAQLSTELRLPVAEVPDSAIAERGAQLYQEFSRLDGCPPATGRNL